MDKFLIELQAKLDEAKSKKNINSDISKLQRQINKLKVQAEIDPKVSQQISNSITQDIANGIRNASSKTNRTNSNMASPEHYEVETKEEQNRGFLKNQFAQVTELFNQWLSVSSAITFVVSKAKSAITALKEINSILTEISKTADHLTKSDLENLGESAFSTASKYGKKASEYLTGVQEMYRAGYENSEELAELSTLAQAAGGMDADLANEYLIATDAAYKFKGDTEKLNEVLDGQNYITNQNTLSMKDLAEATRIAASQSASSGITIDKATAAMGTMIAATGQGGDIAARAWKGILMNIQQVEGEVADGEIIDADSISKCENACEALGVSLKEVKNGVISLRDPMQILEELSEAYTALDESDARKANLISAVGGKYSGNQLNALLENWDLYEKMLQDYASGSGSAMEEATKSANNWEGSINRLGNTFTKMIGNIVKSDEVIAVVNCFNSLLSVIDKATSALGSLGTIGIGAGIFAGVKNIGIAYECM